jgi:HEAT repeat protein
LIRLNQPLDTPFLLQQIENGNIELQQNALRALSHNITHDPSIIQAIIMNDDDPDLQISTIHSLTKLTIRNKCDLLIAALSRRAIYVRKSASEALGELGHERAVEPLLVLLKDVNFDIRLSAIRALGQIWKLPDLVKLGSSTSQERTEAATVLGELRDERAVEPLLVLLKDVNFDIRLSAIRALGQIWKLPDLVKLGSSASQERTEAATVLGELKDERAVEPLLALLVGTSAGVRIAAVAALGQLGAEQAVEPLLALLDNASAGVRAAVVGALDRLHHERAIEALHTLQNDQHHMVRAAVAAVLKK